MLDSFIYEQEESIKDYILSLGIDVSLIKNIDLLLTAFVHKSYSEDFEKNISNNKRLEFLGDAVLSVIISKKLYSDYPDKEESDLTLYKISLVRQESLYNVAKNIGLDKQIILGKGEEKCFGRTKKSILEDSLEAFIGYLFLDLGYNEVEKFIIKYVYSTLDDIKSFNFRSNKTLLQELIQKKHKVIPEYINFENEIDGKGNVIDYKAEVFVLGKKIGEGYGINKKTAQENAAKVGYNFILQD